MTNNTYKSLIKTLDLSVIQPLKVEYERKTEIFPTDKNINVHWTMKFPEQPQEIIDDKLLQFYPMFEVELSSNEKNFYLHRTIIGISFEIKDFDKFDKIWNDKDIQEFFRNKQVFKLVWPFFRQQVCDGMSRVGLPPVTLPLVN